MKLLLIIVKWYEKTLSDLACNACPYGVMFVKMSKGHLQRV